MRRRHAFVRLRTDDVRGMLRSGNRHLRDAVTERVRIRGQHVFDVRDGSVVRRRAMHLRSFDMQRLLSGRCVHSADGADAERVRRGRIVVRDVRVGTDL